MSSSPKKSPKRQAPQPGDASTKPDSTTGKCNPAENKNAESELSTETGGLSEFKKADHIIARVVSKVEDEIRVKINELRKASPPLTKADKLEIVGYRSNVVAGFIYFAKIKISGDSFVQARILETPKGDISLQTVTETKTLSDEEDYFKLPKSATSEVILGAVVGPGTLSSLIASAPPPPQDDKDNESNKMDTEDAYETGGLSAFKNVDHVITRVVGKVEDEIKAKINELRKGAPPLENISALEIVGYRSNIVAGYIYFAKIKIPGESFIQARILETPKGDISLQTVTETKTDADEKDYFKLP